MLFRSSAKLIQKAMRIEETVRDAIKSRKPTFGKLLEVLSMDRKTYLPTRIPKKIIHLIFDWWAEVMGKELAEEYTVEKKPCKLTDLMQSKKWADRLNNLPRYLDEDLEWDEKYRQHLEKPTEEEEDSWVNKISSFDDPDSSWIDEMEQDPPEEELQFFDPSPGDKTREIGRAHV